METIHCSRCNHDVLIPAFSDADKQTIVRLLREQSNPLQAIKLMKDQYGLDLKNGKLLTHHITNPQNRCKRCKNNDLPAGIVVCAKCKALNINWQLIVG